MRSAWTGAAALLALGLLAGCGESKTTEDDSPPPEVKTETLPDGSIRMTPIDPVAGQQAQEPAQKQPGAKK